MSFIVKNTTFIMPLDLIAPHSCRGCGQLGEALCKRCKNNIALAYENICPNCKAINPTGICKKCKNLPPTFVLAKRSSVVGTLIHDFKYDSTRAIGKTLAELANDILPIIPGKISIVPLPTINCHVRERGLDHTLYIARRLAKLRHCRVDKALSRAKNTIQVGADRKTRLIQAKSAYTTNPKVVFDPSTTYILLDDVWTTGASMKAAIKKLQQAGVSKIIVLILALS